MKSVIVVIILAAAALTCSRDNATEGPSASAVDSPESRPGTKHAWIYFTKNYLRGTGPGQYDTDCVGTVATEQIGARKGYTIIWHIRPDNSGNDDDRCETLDVSTVNLRFETDVMGAPAMKRLSANAAGVIQGTVTRDDIDLGSFLVHKYQVYIGNAPAGPDPVIVINCSSCGPDIP